VFKPLPPATTAAFGGAVSCALAVAASYSFQDSNFTGPHTYAATAPGAALAFTRCRLYQPGSPGGDLNGAAITVSGGATLALANSKLETLASANDDGGGEVGVLVQEVEGVGSGRQAVCGCALSVRTSRAGFGWPLGPGPRGPACPCLHLCPPPP
jgi:hypothetical protein